MIREMMSVENVLRPGKTYRVDAAKFGAVEAAMLKALPDAAPCVTLAELKPRIAAQLAEELFPGGATAGWWIKSVQLDLEARGVVARTGPSPLRLHRVLPAT